MVSKTITLVNSQGFHMRPAGAFATAMGKYKSEVTIKFNGNDINGGSTIDLICEGEDEDEALKEAVSLIESGFGE